jgi:hypothetical protein
MLGHYYAIAEYEKSEVHTVLVRRFQITDVKSHNLEGLKALRAILEVRIKTDIGDITFFANHWKSRR